MLFKRLGGSRLISSIVDIKTLSVNSGSSVSYITIAENRGSGTQRSEDF